MPKVRKALVAGAGAAGAALIAGLKSEIPQTSGGWALLIGGAVTAGIVFGWATWRVPNTAS